MLFLLIKIESNKFAAKKKKSRTITVDEEED